MNYQQICCRICAAHIQTRFEAKDWADEVCSSSCARELEWRKELALDNKPYARREGVRTVRIAELDLIRSLDTLVDDLKGIPDLKVDRYLIPKNVYHIFAANPPPVGIDFPVATMECGKEMSRVYGLEKVTAFLRELTISSFAVTRTFKKKTLRDLKIIK